MNRFLCLMAALAAIVLAGCGSEAGDDASGSEASLTRLDFTLQPKGPGGPTEQISLDCNPEGATTAGPEVAPACEAAKLIPETAVEPVPNGKACTELFGGPDELNVVGTLNDVQIDVDLNRANGCEIDRFDEWMPVLEQLYPDYRPGSSIQPPL